MDSREESRFYSEATVFSAREVVDHLEEAGFEVLLDGFGEDLLSREGDGAAQLVNIQSSDASTRLSSADDLFNCCRITNQIPRYCEITIEKI